MLAKVFECCVWVNLVELTDSGVHCVDKGGCQAMDWQSWAELEFVVLGGYSGECDFGFDEDWKLVVSENFVRDGGGEGADGGEHIGGCVRIELC